MELGWLPRVPALALAGFTVLFLASARSLSERFDRDHRELGELRRDLERRIEERTLDLQAANALLAEASRTDALTGLLNRRGFLEKGEAEIDRSQRSGKPLCVVMADVDHFKSINDLHGHAAGDVALQGLASLLRSTLRSQDLVGRWGGEEFILLLPETDLHGASQVAELIRRKSGHPALSVGGSRARSPFLSGSPSIGRTAASRARSRTPTRRSIAPRPRGATGSSRYRSPPMPTPA